MQKNFDFPKNNEVVVNPTKNKILSETLHFIPGQRLKIDVEVDSKKQKWQKLAGIFELEVETDVFNTTYIQCPQKAAKAYLYNDEDLHYFTNFTGSKKTALYWYFISLFKVPLGFLPNSKIYDSIPINMMFGGVLKFLQDFVAPVFLFLKVDYELTMKEAGDILSAGDIEMQVIITKKIVGRETGTISSEIKISQSGRTEMNIEFREAKIKLTCQNELD